jgi:AcrR family transcriptional regulator
VLDLAVVWRSPPSFRNVHENSAPGKALALWTLPTYCAGMSKNPRAEGPVATRGPGRPATITRVDVIGAASRLAREVGLDRFTMGQLADELGVAPMTAYHHVANRTELVQLVVEDLLYRVDIPGPDAGAWDVRLKLLESSVRRELGGIPGIRTGLSTNGSEASRRLADAVLEILAEAGFDENTGLLAYGALFTYMVGQLDLDVATERGQDSDDALRFTELTDRTAAGRPTPDEFFDFGFDMLLFGLHEALRSRR